MFLLYQGGSNGRNIFSSLNTKFEIIFNIDLFKNAPGDLSD